MTRNDIIKILSGTRRVKHGKIIQAATGYLRKSKSTSSQVKEALKLKEKEAERLKPFISDNNLWVKGNFNQYLTEGAEQGVYLMDDKFVIKTNDIIFYNSWTDYFYSLLLHNLFFEGTAYELVGFIEQNDKLFSVVKQPFIETAESTKIEDIKKFMMKGGFENTRRNDYFNSDLGIILEDLHDENVLEEKGKLFFIDTVFYLTWVPFEG